MPESAKQAIRILLVDDHTVMRSGLRLLIESEPGMEVVAEAQNRQETLQFAAREQPDVILLDLMLGEDNSLEFLTKLRDTATTSRIIVLTGVRDPQMHRRAVSLGAKGLVMKDEDSHVLLKAIERVCAGEVWLEQSIVARVLDDLTSGGRKQEDPQTVRIATLTEREREIISLVSEGLANKQIARRLHLSESTVHNHLNSIYNKMNVSSRLELVVCAYRSGLTKIPE